MGLPRCACKESLIMWDWPRCARNDIIIREVIFICLQLANATQEDREFHDHHAQLFMSLCIKCYRIIKRVQTFPYCWIRCPLRERTLRFL